jgi:hypothetical protein
MERSKVKVKKKICVVGLKVNQSQALESECSGIADLQFLDSRRSTDDLPTCDHVILMIRFLKKRWTKGAFRTMGHERVHLHSGGVTGVVRRIEALCA